MRIWSRVSVLLAASAFVFTACGDDDGGTGPDAAFTLSVSPSSLTLEAGASLIAGPEGSLIEAAGSGNITVSITRTGGFDDAVTVTVEGLPTGVTANTVTIASGASSGTLTITAGATAVAGTASLTVRASATGLAARTATVNLTVTSPATIGLSLSPSTLSIAQGQSQTTAATLTRTNFTGGVTFSSTGAPTGMTVAFDPSPTTTTASTITVTVGAGVATGTHQLTITASGTGVPNATASLTVTVTAPASSSISLAAAPGTVPIEQGQSGNSTVTITRTNFTGTVNLAASGAPAGVTVAFNPASTTTTTSDVTVSVGAGVAPASYTITITGSGTGIPDATTTLTVTVTAAAGSIALSLNPATLSIPQGSNSNTTLTISRTSFTGAVNLTATGAPAGMTVAFNPASTTTNTSTITVTVGGSVAANTYQVTIEGAGTGISNATVQLSVTVTSTGGGGNVIFSFCAQSGIPLWVAAQSFGGAWTQVAGNNGVFTFTINQRGAVAWVQQDGANTRLEVVYGTATELMNRGTGFCTGAGGTKTINGTTASVGATEFATIAMRGALATQFGMPGPFVLNNVFDGVQDLVATRAAFGSGVPVVNSIYILRDLILAIPSVGTIDFDMGIAPATATATIGGLGADEAIMASIFVSKNGTGASISLNAPVASASQMWSGVPTGSTVDGDLHIQNVIAGPAGNLTGFPFRSILQFNRTVADRTYTLPAHLATPPTITVAGTAPYVTLNSSWAVQGNDYDDFWNLVFVPASGSVSLVTVSGTQGYFGAGPVQLDIPAFGAGFNAAWGMQPGINVSWNFIASGGPAWSGGFSAANLEGAVSFSAGVAGNFTP
jgi:hypothetical protein